MNAIDRAASTDIFALIGFAKGVLIGCRFDEPHRQRAVAEAIAKLDDATDALAKHFPEPAQRADQPVTEEWLRSVGFTRFMQPASENSLSLEKLILRRYPREKAWTVHVDGTNWPMKTRSDVLRLLAALGIPAPQ